MMYGRSCSHLTAWWKSKQLAIAKLGRNNKRPNSNPFQLHRTKEYCDRHARVLASMFHSIHQWQIQSPDQSKWNLIEFLFYALNWGERERGGRGSAKRGSGSGAWTFHQIDQFKKMLSERSWINYKDSSWSRTFNICQIKSGNFAHGKDAEGILIKSVWNSEIISSIYIHTNSTFLLRSNSTKWPGIHLQFKFQNPSNKKNKQALWLIPKKSERHSKFSTESFRINLTNFKFQRSFWKVEINQTPDNIHQAPLPINHQNANNKFAPQWSRLRSLSSVKIPASKNLRESLWNSAKS